MSTEAQRASHPPRPTTPPPSSTPPRPPHPPGRPDGTREPHRRQPETGAEGTSPEAPAGGPANDTVPVQPKGRTAGGTGAFDIRRPTAPSPAASSPDASSSFGLSRSGLSPSDSAPSRPRFPRFDTGGPTAGTPGPDGTPPPPQASARFPDTPPTVGRGAPSAGTAPDGSTAVPRQPAHRPTVRHRDTPAETPSETTTRLRPTAAPAEPTPRTATPLRSAMPPPRPASDDAWAPAPRPGSPDPALSWSGPMTPGGAFGPHRPVVPFGPTGAEGYDENVRPRFLGQRDRSQIVAAAVCLVLGVGLMGGAVTGSWLAGDSGETGARSGFTAAGSLWHSVPVDELFPPTVQGKGAGPGDADRLWTRIAVAPDSGCEDAFDPLLRKLFAPLGCERLLRATYTDATQSHVTTVGLLFTKADAAGMASFADRVDKERLDRRTDLVPLPYPAKGTAAADFGAGQRASWAISVLTDAPVVVYAVSGWADGRTVETPQPAEDAMEAGATSAPAQAGLGHEAQGLADRVERGLRKNVGTTTEQPS
ncbi:hypothetical protein [Streptomyces sp. M2CJ-2]|uniref:hypothetical protein n=1 Tax=Streptomyces sp. M2CJ-2 TaxID=2803948 RepID=UPI001F287B96|nr:hypothetical protein [Streptomyces sp. M2CJ-2]